MKKKLGRTMAWLAFSLTAVLAIADAGADEVYSKTHIFDDDILLGESDAPVTMIIIASPTCIHCKDFFRVWYPAIKSEYVDSGLVRFVFREIPTGNSQFSVSGSLLARCATETRGVAGYVDTFDRFHPDPEPGKRPPNPNEVMRYAVSAGFEESAAKACLEDADLQAIYQRNSTHAFQVLKVSSTPGFVVDGDVVSLGDDFNLLFREQHRLFQYFDKILADRGVESDSIEKRKSESEEFTELASELDVDLSPSGLAVEDKLLLKIWEVSKQRDLTESEKNAFADWDSRYDPSWGGFSHYLDGNGTQAMQQIAAILREKSK